MVRTWLRSEAAWLLARLRAGPDAAGVITLAVAIGVFGFWSVCQILAGGVTAWGVFKAAARFVTRGPVESSTTTDDVQREVVRAKNTQWRLPTGPYDWADEPYDWDYRN